LGFERVCIWPWVTHVMDTVWVLGRVNYMSENRVGAGGVDGR